MQSRRAQKGKKKGFAAGVATEDPSAGILLKARKHCNPQ
jgi:hypothetical protein